MAQYGKQEYWEDRYQKDSKENQQFDWLQRFSPPSGGTVLRDIIAQYVQENAQILIVGCGTSRLHEEMYDEGFQNITSIDSCYTAIKMCQEIYKDDYPNFVFRQMDVRSMAFKDGTFDCVIDKALLDAVVCSDGAAGNC